MMTFKGNFTRKLLSIVCVSMNLAFEISKYLLSSSSIESLHFALNGITTRFGLEQYLHVIFRVKIVGYCTENLFT